MTLSDTQTDRRPCMRHWSATSIGSGSPPITPDRLSCMPCSLPRWIGTGACRFLPCPLGPSPFLRRVGIHDFTFEACSSFTHVTACRIAHPPSVGFIARLRLDWLPGRTARKLPGSTDKSPGGSFPHWWSAPLGRT